MKPTPEYTCESQLVESLKRKDQKAITFLYDRYAPVLFTSITKIITDRQLAEDVLQNVFIKAWQHIEAYHDSKGKLFTWLLKISRNEAIDVFRSLSYRKRHFFVSVKSADAQELYYPYRYSDTIGIKKALSQLTPAEKMMVELANFEGCTCQQIADFLLLPLGTVKTTLRRAYRKLRLTIGDEFKVGMEV